MYIYLKGGCMRFEYFDCIQIEAKVLPKIYFAYPKDFKGLIRPLNKFFGGLSMFGVHP